mmetsp:Transcript_24980/g.53865  ORF Transcript_24980/g.53865 Transcript_24980/m.53865 type:complete len:211 (+) Transcript_24980:259-891(+)
MFRNTSSAPSSRKASRMKLRSLLAMPPLASAVVVPASSSGKSLNRRLTMFLTANAPCRCTLTFISCRFIAVSTEREPPASRMARAFAGRRSAMAASVPHACSCITAVEGKVCMAWSRCGRTDGVADEELEAHGTFADPRQRFVLISSFPQRLRNSPNDAATNRCCFLLLFWAQSSFLLSAALLLATSQPLPAPSCSAFVTTGSTPNATIV